MMINDTSAKEICCMSAKQVRSSIIVLSPSASFYLIRVSCSHPDVVMPSFSESPQLTVGLSSIGPQPARN